MNKLILPVVIALSAGIGCTVRMTRPEPSHRPPPPAPAPQVQRMTADEAVARAVDHARFRGFERVSVDKVHLTGNDVWKVKLEVDRRDAEGKIHVELDAWTRKVLRAQEHVKFDKRDRKYKHKHGDRDDDDDDRKGKKRHKASPVAHHKSR